MRGIDSFIIVKSDSILSIALRRGNCLKLRAIVRLQFKNYLISRKCLRTTQLCTFYHNGFELTRHIPYRRLVMAFIYVHYHISALPWKLRISNAEHHWFG